MWRPQINVLSTHFRVIAPDLWGHGDAEPMPQHDRSLDGLARWHLALLDALDITCCHIVGSSVGGMWAARLALHEPERVDRLVLMGTALGAEDVMTQTRYYQMLDRIAEAGKVDSALVDTVEALFFHPNGRTIPAHRQAFRQSLLNHDAITLRESLVPLGRMIFGRPDLLDSLESLHAERTLIMGGERDMPRTPAESRITAERIGCRYVLVPDAGHIMNLEKPDFVNAMLTNWLQEPSPAHHAAMARGRKNT